MHGSCYLTSAGQPDDAGDAARVGISVCLAKPVRKSELSDA